MRKFNLITESFFSEKTGNILVTSAIISSALSLYTGFKEIMAGRKQDKDYVIKMFLKSRRFYNAIGFTYVVNKIDKHIEKIQNMTEEQYKDYMYSRASINIIGSIIIPPLMVILKAKYFNKK